MLRVLIVEPDAAFRNDLARSVRAAGWAPCAVDDPAEASARLTEVGAEVALVDVAGRDSVHALAELRRRAPGLALVAMSGEPTLELAVEAMKRGARDFLRKPFSVQALETALAGALPGRRAEASGDAHAILTEDAGMERLLRQVRAAAVTEATVQIVGESGTGKDLLARWLHREGPRRHAPYIAVSCAGLPESLAESELFGHERGAFTGAIESRAGQIVAAQGGTLLLDEVAELAPALQPKLLRVLQEREVLPVGGLVPRPVDVRVVATTQRDLRAEVGAGRFREDLYYRLEVIVLHVPPLRERPGDVPLLARTFLSRLAESAGVDAPRLLERDVLRLARLPWPGNVRELENLMRRAVVLFPGREVDLERLLARRGPSSAATTGMATLNLRELERQAILRSLAETGGNRTRASRALGISVRTLRNKIRAYELA